MTAWPTGNVVPFPDPVPAPPPAVPLVADNGMSFKEWADWVYDSVGDPAVGVGRLRLIREMMRELKNIEAFLVEDLARDLPAGLTDTPYGPVVVTPRAPKWSHPGVNDPRSRDLYDQVVKAARAADQDPLEVVWSTYALGAAAARFSKVRELGLPPDEWRSKVSVHPKIDTP